jgi:hypothetical protein
VLYSDPLGYVDAGENRPQCFPRMLLLVAQLEAARVVSTGIGMSPHLQALTL